MQALLAAALLRVLVKKMVPIARKKPFAGAVLIVELMLLLLLAIALGQIGVWAIAFILCGQFSDFGTAFYHSAVNFSTLGYGDVVMQKPWRLLGSLEAINGVLMPGLSVSLLAAAISSIGTISRNKRGRSG